MASEQRPPKWHSESTCTARVFQVVDFKSAVKFDMQGHRFWKATMATMAISYPVRSEMDFKCEAKLSYNIIIGIIARESIGPLPSCCWGILFGHFDCTYLTGSEERVGEQIDEVLVERPALRLEVVGAHGLGGLPELPPGPGLGGRGVEGGPGGKRRHDDAGHVVAGGEHVIQELEVIVLPLDHPGREGEEKTVVS